MGKTYEKGITRLKYLEKFQITDSKDHVNFTRTILIDSGLNIFLHLSFSKAKKQRKVGSQKKKELRM